MLIRELENSDFILYSKELQYNDGSTKWNTWVYIKKDCFSIMDRLHNTIEEKNDYVNALKPEFKNDSE